MAGPARRGRTLPDEVAYELIDSRCGKDFARGFLLYELYTRGAAFTRSGEDD